MRKIYRVPVIGYILRVLAAVIKLPKHIDLLRKDLTNLQEQQNEQIDELKAEIEAKDKQIAELNRKIETEKTKRFYEGFDCIISDCNCLEQLNTQLSIHPTIWGDKERLQISPLAAVFTCFFNTNSGSITVGDYTFAGSNVSLLAGNHDMFLEGLSRRDAEIKQGCDIVIGKGVWLASGCTILGPCTIGDNAVVAAGAVVTPGTEIPADTVYAGVPAKMIRKIEKDMDIGSRHIMDAVEREAGVLFVDGWSEKRYIIYADRELGGHWILRSGALVYTNRKKLRVFCHKDKEESIEIAVEQGTKRKYILLEECDTEFLISVEQNADKLSEISVYYDGETPINLFISIMQTENEE